MCGIFALLALSGKLTGGIPFSKDLDLHEFFIYGKYTGFKEKRELKVKSEELDPETIIKGLRQRGPDSLRGLLIETRLSQEGEVLEVKCKWIEDVDNKETLKDVLKTTLGDTKEIETEEIYLRVLLVSSVLSMRRGADGQICRQPLLSEDDSLVAMLNGEIYDVRTQDLLNHGDDPILVKAKEYLDTFSPNLVDTIFIFGLLHLMVPNKDESSSNYHERLVLVLRCLIGEFTLLFGFPKLGQYFVVKDCYGKRSLLVGKLDNGMLYSSILPLTIESTKVEPFAEAQPYIDDLEEKYMSNYRSAVDSKLVELPANHLFSLDYSRAREHKSIVLDSNFVNILAKKLVFEVIAKKPEGIDESKPIEITKPEAVKLVSALLEQSIRRIIQNIYRLGQECKFEDTHNHTLEQVSEGMEEKEQQLITKGKVAVLFSGGLDSALIAHYLAAELPANEE